ncbi:MAG: hypothetical protein JSW40_04450 [Candidatus Omnitrophota bacterium]|nr:MAG: hypothetical protein JSW40_04450 [Candidatus Omnitrophota bacterium]
MMGKIWKILKPNKFKITLFMILVVIMFFLLYATPFIKIFPCKMMPPGPPTAYTEERIHFAPGYISLGPGPRIYYPSAYVLLFSLLFVAPYIMACVISSLLKRNKVIPPPQSKGAV